MASYAEGAYESAVAWQGYALHWRARAEELALALEAAKATAPIVPVKALPPSIRVARDIHENGILFRRGEREGWTAEMTARSWELWRSFERSDAFPFRGDMDAWDAYWVRAYEEALGALAPPVPPGSP